MDKRKNSPELTPRLKKFGFTQELLQRLVDRATSEGGYWKRALDFIYDIDNYETLSTRQWNWLVGIVDELKYSWEK